MDEMVHETLHGTLHGTLQETLQETLHETLHETFRVIATRRLHEALRTAKALWTIEI